MALAAAAELAPWKSWFVRKVWESLGWRSPTEEISRKKWRTYKSGQSVRMLIGRGTVSSFLKGHDFVVWASRETKKKEEKNGKVLVFVMEQCTARSWARFERAGKSDRDNVITHPPVPLRIPPNFFFRRGPPYSRPTQLYRIDLPKQAYQVIVIERIIIRCEEYQTLKALLYCYKARYEQGPIRRSRWEKRNGKSRSTSLNPCPSTSWSLSMWICLP